MNTEPELSELLSEFARTLLTDFPGQSTLDRLVVRILKVLPISAAAVTLRTADSDAVYIAASDRRALRLEQLQSEIGEGPSRLVFASGTALSISDVATDERLGPFGPRVVDSGFRAMFSFPLREGAMPLGTLDVYAEDPGPLEPRQLEIAQTLADVAAAYTINATARGDLVDAAADAHQSSMLEQEGDRALRASVRSNRRASAALDASEARNTAILASALDAVITVDEQGRVVDFNASAERIFGYSEVEVSGRKLADLIVPPQERDAHRQRWEGLLANGDTPPLSTRSESMALRADGTLFPAEVSTHVVGGPRPFVTGFVRDLTAEKAAHAERADLEAQLQQVQRLESLGRLAGGVAHDFNNLLTVIIGIAGSIEEASPDDGDIRPYARQILEAGIRAARLTHQLLVFARRQPVRYGSVDLNAVVDEVRDLLAQTIGDDVRLVLDLAADLPTIHADRGQTDQVLLNLAGNARDAMPDGGTLTIRTNLTTLDETHPRVRLGMVPGEYVELSVEDSGEGMAPEVVSHAFDPFFTTRPPGQNSGLGLATVHGIVNDAGGMVTLRSEVGRGTTVTALFPVDNTPQPLPVHGDDVAVGESGGETILVVEDEPAVLEVTGRMLRQHGYITLEASSVADAIAVFDRERVDLLLTDVVMPVGSGRELAEELQSRNARLPVLFMSGSIAETFGTEPRRLAPDLVFLQKPFEAATLGAAVAAALRGRVGKGLAGGITPTATASGDTR